MPQVTRIYQIVEVVRKPIGGSSVVRELADTFSFDEHLQKAFTRLMSDAFTFTENLNATVTQASGGGGGGDPTAFPEAVGWGGQATVA